MRPIFRSLSHLLNILKVGPFLSDVIMDCSEYTSLEVRNYPFWRNSELLYIPCVNNIAFSGRQYAVQIWFLNTLLQNIVYVDGL